LAGLDDRLPSRVLFAGRFEYLKGAAALLEAMPLAVAAVGRGLKHTLADEGRQRAALEAQAAKITADEPAVGDYVSRLARCRADAGGISINGSAGGAEPVAGTIRTEVRQPGCMEFQPWPLPPAESWNG
jgi:hypothetical protein